MYEYNNRDAKICQPYRKPRSNTRRPTIASLLGKPLSLRELQIASMIAEGFLNKEIGEKLSLTEGTVKVYVGEIFAKTGLTNRTQVCRWVLLKSDNPSKSE